MFFASGVYGIAALTEVVEIWLEESLALDTATFFGAKYLRMLMGGALWVLFKFIFFIIFGTLGGYVIIMLLSPVFAFLSEKTDEIITGNNYPFNMDQLVRDAVRGVVIAMRNMFIELGYIVLFFIIGFVPVIGQFAAVVLFFISAYFYGFSFIDYSNERKKYTIQQSVKYVRKHKGMAIGNGIVFTLVLLIPFCGVTLAGFVAIVSVVAATIATHEVESKEVIINE